MIIEITTHGSSLRKKRERFIIKTPDDEVDHEIDAHKVEAIIVSANAMISSAAIGLCIERQIQMVFTTYYGKPVGRIWTSSFGRQTQIRRQQYLNLDTSFAFEITQKLLIEKLDAQRNYLLKLKHNRKKSEMVQYIAKAVSYFDGIINTIKKSKFEKNFSAHFLGYEGACAAKYFEILSICLPTNWQFKGRSHNPSLDPFNACLNYMYGMAYIQIEKIVILSGLDPTAGFYHRDSYAKPTLVFDLIEPCRAMVDKALIYLFSKKIVKDNWFESDSQALSTAVYLTKNGRNMLIGAYKDNCQKQIDKQTWKNCKGIAESLLKMDKFSK